MSSEQKSGGLPTAAIVDAASSARYEDCLKIPVASEEMSKEVLEWGDELVRRSDVKALIQDKIEVAHGSKDTWTERKTKADTEKEFEENKIKKRQCEAVIEALKELLEELEQ